MATFEKHNLSYTTNPGYLDLFRDGYEAISWYYRADNWDNYTFPQSFFEDFSKYYDFPLTQKLPILYIGILFTLARYLFEKCICKSLINSLKIDSKSDREKLPESLWKCLVYSILWSFCAHLLVFKYNYFMETAKIWDGWFINMEIPQDVTLLYFVECGFYLHSIFATIFMDTWRKDSIVMLIHHFLTMTLIIVSYATRYHRVGLLVLFVHDVTDILLEFTKCNVYMKRRNGKFYAAHEHISNIGFATFTFAWYLFRLYWFPLKIIYATSVTSIHIAYYKGAGLYFFFNSLLWFLLILDIYWFYFIVLFLYKVATGQLSEINDTRDYDEDEEDKLAKKRKASSQHSNGTTSEKKKEK